LNFKKKIEMERKKDEEKKEKKEKEEIKKLNRALHFAVMKICEQEGTFFFFLICKIKYKQAFKQTSNIWRERTY